jgi:hypothetical protein
MRHLLLAVALGLATSASAQTPSPLTVHNNAMDFVEFWDAAKGLSKEEQLAKFKARVAPAFPAFYGIERYNGKVTQAKRDSQIQRAIDEFAPIRDAYIIKARNFEAELPKNIATFKASFPDFVPPGDIYVLHSLGEMDGGVRDIGGKQYLIFGVDGMVLYHGKSDDSPFFHHELFHTYHTAAADCGEAQLGVVVARRARRVRGQSFKSPSGQSATAARGSGTHGGKHAGSASRRLGTAGTGAR